jgi:hypothetical protein
MARPVLVTAVFDAHREDPLADLTWSAGDYAALARVACCRTHRDPAGSWRSSKAATTSTRSVMATVAAMAESLADDEPPMSGGPGREVVELVARTRTALG